MSRHGDRPESHGNTWTEDARVDTFSDRSAGSMYLFFFNSPFEEFRLSFDSVLRFDRFHMKRTRMS